MPLMTEPPLPMTADFLSPRSITVFPPFWTDVSATAAFFFFSFFGISTQASSSGAGSAAAFLPFFFVLPCGCGAGAGSGAITTSSSESLSSHLCLASLAAFFCFFGRTGFDALTFFFCLPPMRGACGVPLASTSSITAAAGPLETSEAPPISAAAIATAPPITVTRFSSAVT